MSRANAFLWRMGLLELPGFFSEDLCRALREEVRLGQSSAALVRARDATEARLNELHRRTRKVEVSRWAMATVSERLALARPLLCSYMRVSLSELEPPQFLRYRPGDFFARHTDGPTPLELQHRQRGRKVSLIVQLNSELASEPGTSYSGGRLVFHGFGDPAPWSYPLLASTGALIAFPSYVPHAVTPVVTGERLTIVSWYY